MLRPWKTILHINLDCEKAVFQQIADGITEEIRKGRLQPGMPLPGSRVLADDLGVNRKTVVLAYEELLAEGWLQSAYKRGTFVSEKLPVATGSRKRQGERNRTAPERFGFMMHRSGMVSSRIAEKSVITFNDGLPDVKLAPLDELSRAYKRIFQQKARCQLLGYGNERGEERLRAAVSTMLTHDRGLHVKMDSICITRGSQMALYLTAHTLVRPGDVVAIESPGYLPAFEAFTYAGARMHPVKVNEQGICVVELEKLCRRKKVKAVYVTPHHQFPTTVSMKADRRMELIALSNKYGFAIVEDDYDHDYHFGLRNLLPLASYADAANVIYISSLSKLIAPAVRIGYVTGPKDFIDSLSALRMIIDRQGDTVMEHAVAELMEEGIIHKHARKALGVYRERREHMAVSLDKYAHRIATYRKPEGGLAYWITFNQYINTEELAVKLLKKGVQVTAPDKFFFDNMPVSALRLGFASLDNHALEEGVKIIAANVKF
ncbi:MAG TPA: PLP-dependent aminotransferase family protein [Chitinophaga sp.]|uniref:MocR-like pyridoxine biosynthesis transcription factor PdxR n=1 Tax=Chitinophaga sp. TaxID=1869181 RepID=UPI002C29D916|nr:PLP-dependent aminotransferase family protein [Chitinophaga sp.]HVI48623.1 PLP-dependent aminotransferase family protein [Chitinophaga sp.]